MDSLCETTNSFLAFPRSIVSISLNEFLSSIPPLVSRVISFRFFRRSSKGYSISKIIRSTILRSQRLRGRLNIRAVESDWRIGGLNFGERIAADRGRIGGNFGSTYPIWMIFRSAGRRCARLAEFGENIL